MIIKFKINTGIISKNSADIIKAFRGSDQEVKYTMGKYSFTTAMAKLFIHKWQARMYYGEENGKRDPTWVLLFREYDKEGGKSD